MSPPYPRRIFTMLRTAITAAIVAVCVPVYGQQGCPDCTPADFPEAECYQEDANTGCDEEFPNYDPQGSLCRNNVTTENGTCNPDIYYSVGTVQVTLHKLVGGPGSSLKDEEDWVLCGSWTDCGPHYTMGAWRCAADLNCVCEDRWPLLKDDNCTPSGYGGGGE